MWFGEVDSPNLRSDRKNKKGISHNDNAVLFWAEVYPELPGNSLHQSTDKKIGKL